MAKDATLSDQEPYWVWRGDTTVLLAPHPTCTDGQYATGIWRVTGVRHLHGSMPSVVTSSSVLPPPPHPRFSPPKIGLHGIGDFFSPITLRLASGLRPWLSPVARGLNKWTGAMSRVGGRTTDRP